MDRGNGLFPNQSPKALKFLMQSVHCSYSPSLLEVCGRCYRLTYKGNHEQGLGRCWVQNC